MRMPERPVRPGGVLLPPSDAPAPAGVLPDVCEVMRANAALRSENSRLRRELRILREREGGRPC